jgi:hypothetical protein
MAKQVFSTPASFPQMELMTIAMPSVLIMDSVTMLQGFVIALMATALAMVMAMWGQEETVDISSLSSLLMTSMAPRLALVVLMRSMESMAQKSSVVEMESVWQTLVFVTQDTVSLLLSPLTFPSSSLHLLVSLLTLLLALGTDRGRRLSQEELWHRKSMVWKYSKRSSSQRDLQWHRRLQLHHRHLRVCPSSLLCSLSSSSLLLLSLSLGTVVALGVYSKATPAQG